MWSLTILMLAIFILYCQLLSSTAITTNGCGATIGCLREPPNCNIPGCDYLATYQSQGDQVTFELFGKDARWVAIGFSADTRMANTDAVFCYGNNTRVLIRSAKLTGQFLPLLNQATDLNFINGSIDTGSISCSFRHPLRPNSTSTLRNLDDNLYLLYAKGPLSGENPANHGVGSPNRGSSDQPVNLTQKLILGTPTSPTDVGNEERPSSSVITQTITTEGCGQTKGCLRLPAQCESAQCTYLATYRRQGDQVIFELFARDAAYVAIGFNNDPQMPGTDSVFCYGNGGSVLIRSGKLIARSLPPLIEDKDLNLTVGSTNGGSISCRFGHPLRPENSSNLRNLDDIFYIIYAKGPLSGNTPDNHGMGAQARGFSDQLVNVTSTFESQATSPSDLKKKVHGSLMVIVWIIFASTGLFFARYTRNNWSDVKLLDQKVWFQFHRLLMITVVLGTIASIVIIFVDLERFVEVQGPAENMVHAILGLAVVYLSISQPIGALFRPHPGASKRPCFNFIHRSIGLAAFILSLVVTLLGLDIFQRTTAFYVVVGYVVFLLFVVIAMEVVKILYENKGKETAAGHPNTRKRNENEAEGRVILL